LSIMSQNDGVIGLSEYNRWIRKSPFENERNKS
jgi:hypothetical protein